LFNSGIFIGNLMMKFLLRIVVCLLPFCFFIYVPACDNQSLTNPNSPSPTPDNIYPYLGQWGSQGSGDGQFQYPSGIIVDTLGNVYVTDMSNNRIEKFNSSGVFLAKWGKNGGDGTPGSGDGEFKSPYDIAIDSSNNIYVADTYNYRVQKFTSAGVFIAKWGKNGGDGTSGVGDGEFDNINGIFVDSSGNIYVADTGNNRIQKLTSSGVFVTKWGKNNGDGTSGSGDGEFSSPKDVVANSSGNVYVVDGFNHRIQTFDVNGAAVTFITKWGKNNGDGTSGTGDGEFFGPFGLALDFLGNAFVVDSNNRIQKFTPTGGFMTKWGKNGGDGTAGSGNGEFNGPSKITFDSSGNIYVTDTQNYRIQKFGP
jgi:tripartite motif-containing protein 71